MLTTTKYNQTTISKKISLSGVGLHTGKDVTLTFHPSEANSGYVFKRIDLENEPVIEADINYVTNTERRRKRRAQRISDRKLMSEEQAQDFMRNRKDRFNTAFGNVLLDLTGNEDQMKRVKDRYYRKEGSGTIQNVAKLDKDGKPTGETYNAMDPFQFARTRIKAEKGLNVPKKGYEIIQPKPMADLTIDIKEPEKIQEKIVEKKKEKEIIDLTDPSPGTPTLDTSVNIITDTVNATTPSLGEEGSFMTEGSQKERDRRGLAANRGGFFQRLFNIGG